MTGRRKGTPCGCDADPCGYSPRNQCIKTINGQYPDANHEFEIEAGEGISIIPSEHGITINGYPIPAVLFKGTVGTGGTIATLPVADEDNLGWMFIAVSSGSTPDTPAKTFETGDMLISNGIEWTVVPSGDDPVDWSQIQNKPTTLDGYGITDAVDTTSNQDIRGYKTFMSDTYTSVTIKSARTAGNIGGIAFHNGNGNQLNNIHSSNSGIITVDLVDGNQKALEVVNQRAYDSGNVNDIVTIGSLASNPSVVHTTGNETINGVKTHLNNILFKTSGDVTDGNASNHIIITVNDKNNEFMANLWVRITSSGNTVLYTTLRNSDGSQKTVNLASGDII